MAALTTTNAQLTLQAGHTASCTCSACNGPRRIQGARLPLQTTLKALAPRRAAALRVQASSTPVVNAAAAVLDSEATEQLYMAGRVAQVRQHFPSALSVDDFMHRVEMCAFSFGFSGDNTIAMTCLCRDEISATVKNKIDEVFGASFNTNGLGGIMTCGVTGIKAGLSHAPICPTTGKERYIFIAMPHIAIDAAGRQGVISRPGRPGDSCACGALAASLNQIKADGLEKTALPPGVHDFDEPELSILKQRLARRIVKEEWDAQRVNDMDLVEITALANRTITSDLEYLISKAVDPSKADYIVVTGVEIHNWGTDFDNDSPNLEFVAVTDSYAVIDGQRTDFDIEAVPSLTPRQVAMLANARRELPRQANPVVNAASNLSTVARSIDTPILYSTSAELKAKQERAARYAKALQGVPMLTLEQSASTVLNVPSQTAAASAAAAAPSSAAVASPPAEEPSRGVLGGLLGKLFKN